MCISCCCRLGQTCIDAVAEPDHNLLLKHRIVVPFSAVVLHDDEAVLTMSNLGKMPRTVTQETVVAHLYAATVGLLMV